MQKVQHLCDMCFAAMKEEVATTLGVQFGIDKNQMVVDLCDTHNHNLSLALDPYFQVGRRPDAVTALKPPSPSRKGGPKPTPAGDFHCPVNGCTRSFTNNQGLSMHKTRVHQIPGIEKHGQAAHDAAVLAASGDDVAPGTTPPSPAPNEALERKRAADRARKQRKRDALREVGQS